MKLYIVLTGFYFKYIDLYQKIVNETKLYKDINFNLFILSHKSKREIPKDLYSHLIENQWQIIFENNVGWDWGCHVQFMQWIDKQNSQKPDFLLFLHDDISIIQSGFIQEFLNMYNRGYQLIGNSKPFTIINQFEKDYYDEAQILKKHGFDFEHNKIEIVRGSAFFITYKLAQQALKNLPYQKCGSINLANRSLRMFGAISTKIVGREKISYLSDEHFKSDFITEEMRGSDISSKFFLKRFIRSKITTLYYILEKYILFKLVYGHLYAFKTVGLLKINITDKKILQGYLNICINDIFCSDISFIELDKLIIENKINRIIISSRIVFDDPRFFERILRKLVKSKIPVDLFIDAEDISLDTINQFKYRNYKLDLKLKKKPLTKGKKWVNHIYMQYPQYNLKPE